MTPPPTSAGSDTAPPHQRVHRGSARSTLLNVLGEFVLTRGHAVSTAALLASLDDAGLQRYAARQAVSRCSRAGWIEGSRVGRTSEWTLTPSGTSLLQDGIRRVAELGEEPPPWDGRWLMLVVSIPQDLRSVRQRLYRSLTWAGLGTPTPGIWITPHAHRADGILGLIDRLGLRETTISTVGSLSGIGLRAQEIVGRAWDLDAVAEHYGSLVRSFGRRRPRTGADAMRALLELHAELQRIPLLDPWLPTELLPRFRGRSAAARLLERRATWLGPARERWVEHLDGS